MHDYPYPWLSLHQTSSTKYIALLIYSVQRVLDSELFQVIKYTSGYHLNTFIDKIAQLPSQGIAQLLILVLCRMP